MVPPGIAASHHVSEEQVLAVLREAIAIVLEVAPETVTRDTRLSTDLAADSLALVEIVDIVEGRLAELVPTFRIDDADVDAIETVGAVVDYAITRLRTGAG